MRQTKRNEHKIQSLLIQTVINEHKRQVHRQTVRKAVKEDFLSQVACLIRRHFKIDQKNLKF